MKRKSKKSKATLLRNKTGMTQAELAAEAGLAKNYISAIECGRSYPGPNALESIANALGVTMRKYANALK